MKAVFINHDERCADTIKKKKRQFYILEKFVISYNRAQRHLHSQHLVKCAGDQKIILCCIKDQDSWIIWESLAYYMHVIAGLY